MRDLIPNFPVQRQSAVNILFCCGAGGGGRNVSGLNFPAASSANIEKRGRRQRRLSEQEIEEQPSSMSDAGRRVSFKILRTPTAIIAHRATQKIGRETNANKLRFAVRPTFENTKMPGGLGGVSGRARSDDQEELLSRELK